MNGRTFDEQLLFLKKRLYNREITVYELQELLLISEKQDRQEKQEELDPSYYHTYYSEIYYRIIETNSQEDLRTIRIALSMAILDDRGATPDGLLSRFLSDKDHRSNSRLKRPISVSGYDLKILEKNKHILALKVVIHESKIEKIHYLVDGLDPYKMSIFRDVILSSSHITELGISISKISDENLWMVNAILDMIADSKISSLFIKAGEDYKCECLSKWDGSSLKHLFEVLKHLDSLNLTGNLIGEISFEKIRPLFLNIATLSTLNLTKNKLNLWNSQPEIWRKFFAAIESSSIKNLSLARNDLSSWTLEQVIAFSNAIKESKIENLDLSGCYLEKWTLEQLKIICNAIKDSKVNRLNIQSHSERPNEQILSEAQSDILFNTFNDTAIAIKATYHEDSDHPVVKMIIRNNKLRNTCKMLTDNTYLYMKWLPDLEVMSQSDEGRLSTYIYYDEDGMRNSIENAREAMETLEMCIELLSEWRALPFPRASKEGCDLLQSTIAIFLDTIFAHEFLIPELLCALPATQYKTRELYGKYFDYTYVTQCDLGESKESALLQAMEYCVDVEKNPVNFAEHEQRVFDAYLTTACGVEDRLDTTVSTKQRHDLLQYYLLRILTQQMPRLISEKNNLSQEILVGLNDELKSLPKINSIAQLDTNTSKILSNLFEKAQKKLTRGNVSLSDITQNHCFEKAWEYTIKIINHEKENEINLKKIYEEAINSKIPLSSFLTALPTCLNDSHELKFYSAEQQKIFDSFLLKVCRLDSINDDHDLNNVDRLILLRYLVVTTLDQKSSSTQTFLSSKPPLVKSISDLASEAEKLGEMEQKIHKKLLQSSSGIPAEWQPVFKCILNLHKVAKNNPQPDQSQGIKPG